MYEKPFCKLLSTESFSLKTDKFQLIVSIKHAIVEKQMFLSDLLWLFNRKFEFQRIH